jgi:hypothetical protein
MVNWMATCNLLNGIKVEGWFLWPGPVKCLSDPKTSYFSVNGFEYKYLDTV